MFKVINRSDKLLLKKLIPVLNKYKYKYSVVTICILLGLFMAILQPIVWGKLFSIICYRNIELLWTYIFYISSIFITRIAIGYIQSYLTTLLSNSITHDLRTYLYGKIIHLPVAAFDKTSVGSFISHIHGDTSSICDLIVNQILNNIVEVLKVIAISIIVFKLNIYLAAIVLSFFPINYYTFLYYSKILRPKSWELRNSYDKLFSYIQQSLSGIREIKSLGIENNSKKSFSLESCKLNNNIIDLSITNITATTLSEVINIISEVIVIAVGGYLISRNIIKIEYFIAFTSYSRQLSSSLINITQINSKLQQSLASLERMSKLTDNSSYDDTIYGTTPMNFVKGEIEFKNIYFSYNKNKSVLEDISFKVKSKQKVAIVGRSGSGKTTIFNLILRFYNPSAGKVTIDAVDIKEWSEDSLRTNIAIVRQEPFIFCSSIIDNLLLSNPNATQEDLVQACKSAYIHEYIMSLPGNYEFVIKESGVNLSSGQKQRLAIARVFLKKSSIILFDEATSYLDSESQMYINKAINKLAKNHTVLIIAHRLSTILDSDNILVMDNGKLIGYGKHETLIHDNKIYKNLFETEFNAI